jgi:hypothetical protein
MIQILAFKEKIDFTLVYKWKKLITPLIHLNVIIQIFNSKSCKWMIQGINYTIAHLKPSQEEILSFSTPHIVTIVWFDYI